MPTYPLGFEDLVDVTLDNTIWKVPDVSCVGRFRWHWPARPTTAISPATIIVSVSTTSSTTAAPTAGAATSTTSIAIPERKRNVDVVIQIEFWMSNASLTSLSINKAMENKQGKGL